MMRYATGLIAVMCLVGCRAPAPSFNAFAPYGTPHVPPPTTGSVGTPNSYYQAPSGLPPAQPSAQPPTTGLPTTPLPTTPLPTTPTGPTAPTLGTPPTTPLPTYGASTETAGMSGVAQASYQQPVDGTRSVLVNGSQGSTTLNLNGMHVNDATGPTEPQAFTPDGTEMVEISQLPPATPTTRSPSVIRVIQPTTTSTSSATSSSGNWQSR